MNKPHKWAKEIKAWADGQQVETKFYKDQIWDLLDINSYPAFSDDEYVFRIKPQPKEPQYLYVYMNKQTGNPVFDFEEPNSILEDEYCVFVSKIKLEVDDEK
jgi:hypothetical protein